MKLRRILVIQLRKGIMPPPAVIAAIIWPFFLIMELKKAMILAVSGHIGTCLITAHAFIDPLPVQPFIKRTTVIEHTIDDHLHAPAMHLFYKLGEK